MNESSGTSIKDSISDKKANVVNPHWLKIPAFQLGFIK